MNPDAEPLFSVYIQPFHPSNTSTLLTASPLPSHPHTSFNFTKFVHSVTVLTRPVKGTAEVSHKGCVELQL